MSESDTDENGEKTVEQRQQEIIDKEPMVRLFSSSSIPRILVVLRDIHGDATASKITETAGVSRTTWYNNVDLLKQLNVVEVSRNEAGATFYQLADSEQANAVVRLSDSLLEANHNND